MLKNPASFVLTSLRSSTYPRGYASSKYVARIALDGAHAAYGNAPGSLKFPLCDVDMVPAPRRISFGAGPTGSGMAHE
jgi:hypothetical protein